MILGWSTLTHGDLTLALTRCLWPSPRAFARADYANQDWFPLHCAAAAVHWVLDTGGATPMLKRRSLFERRVTLLVGTWSVARKQSFRCVGGHVQNLTTSYFDRKETKFVGNKTAIYPSKLLFWLSSLCQNSPFLVSFLRLTDLSHTQEQAGSMPSTQAVAPSASHHWPERRQWEGVNVRQKNPSPQTLRSPKIRERLVVTARSTARSFRSMSSYGRVLAASSRVLAARSEPVFFFIQTFVDFALSLPGHSLWACLRPGPSIFSQKRKNTDKKWN